MSTRPPSTDRGTTSVVPDLGHPVRSFTFAMLGLGLLLLALQWTGVVHPDLESQHGYSTSFGRLEIVMVEVHNAGALPVRIEDATWPTAGMEYTKLGLAPDGWNDDGGSLDLAHIPALRPFTLDPQHARWLAITVVPGCVAEVGEPSVEVRTTVGLRRTVDLRGQQAKPLAGTC